MVNLKTSRHGRIPKLVRDVKNCWRLLVAIIFVLGEITE